MIKLTSATYKEIGGRCFLDIPTGKNIFIYLTDEDDRIEIITAYISDKITFEEYTDWYDSYINTNDVLGYIEYEIIEKD